MQVKRGTTRVVLLAGPYAVKLPTPFCGFERFLLGLVANMRERRWWRDAKRSPDVDPHHRLCPVVFSIPGGILVVMKRAEVPRNLERKMVRANKYRDFKPDVVKWIWKEFANLPVDPAVSNFGFIGRHMVLIDYGS